jgi:hypothetical protein
MCKEEIAHTTKYESLVNRVLRKCNDSLDSWINSQSERATYISRATVCELLQCIGECLDKTLTESVVNSKYALMADESTNVSNQSELSICIRCVKNSEPVEIFLTIVTVANTTAETVSEAICHELSTRNLLLDNLVAFGFDGAAQFLRQHIWREATYFRQSSTRNTLCSLQSSRAVISNHKHTQQIS